MKRIFKIGSIVGVLTLLLIPITDAQPPSTPDLTGKWEVTIINENYDWGEKTTKREIISVTIYLDYVEGPLDPREYNLFWWPEGIDTFRGFIHENMFVFYKENLDNCGGPDFNFGREMIVGMVNRTGTRLMGDGMGFDSNPGCGGWWTYTFTAKKISDDLPF